SHDTAREGALHVLDRLRRTGMEPEPAEPLAKQASGFRRLEKEWRQGKNLARLASEKRRLDDTDAGMDERRDLALRPTPQAAIGRHVEVTRRIDTHARRRRRDEQQYVHLF